MIDERIEQNLKTTSLNGIVYADYIQQNYVPKTTLAAIRAEIKQEAGFAYADFERYKVACLGVDADYAEDELPTDDFRYGMERAIEIIDQCTRGNTV